MWLAIDSEQRKNKTKKPAGMCGGQYEELHPPRSARCLLSHHRNGLNIAYINITGNTYCDAHSSDDKRDEERKRRGNDVKASEWNIMRNKIDKCEGGFWVVWTFSRSRRFVAEIRQSCPHPPSPANNWKWECVNINIKYIKVWNYLNGCTLAYNGRFVYCTDM